MGSAALIVQAINRCGTDSLIRLAVREAGDGK
jgi:hypothetical protein